MRLNFDFDSVRNQIGCEGKLNANPPLSKLAISLQSSVISFTSRWDNYSGQVSSNEVPLDDALKSEP